MTVLLTSKCSVKTIWIYHVLLKQYCQRWTSLTLVNLAMVSYLNFCQKQKLSIPTFPTTQQSNGSGVLLWLFDIQHQDRNFSEQELSSTLIVEYWMVLVISTGCRVDNVSKWTRHKITRKNNACIMNLTLQWSHSDN